MITFSTKVPSVFVSSLVLALTSSNALNAQEINYGTPAQTITGVTELMPTGGQGQAGTAIQTRKMLKRRIPIGEDKLDKIKQDAANQPRRSSVETSSDMTQGELDQHSEPSQLTVTQICRGNSSTGWTPSDIHGAVGPTNFIIVTNVNITIRNKSACAPITNQGLKLFFNSVGVPANTTLFDPRVIYDPLTDRFFVTVESSHSTLNDQYQYFAISTNSSGTAWHKYRLTLSEGSTFFCKQASNSFWDYPQAGVNSKRWFISANDFGTTVPGQLMSIDKAPTLSGAATTVRCFQNNPPNLSVPIVHNGILTAYLLSPGSGGGSSIARRDYVTNAGSHASDVIITRPSFTITPWSAAPNAPQPNGVTLDTLDGRFQSQSTQLGNQLWNVHTINGVGRAVLRAYRLQATSAAVSTVLRERQFCGVGNGVVNCLGDVFNPSVATSYGPPASTKLFFTFTRTIRSGEGFSVAAGRAKHMMMVGVGTLGGPFLRNVIRSSSSEYTSCGSSCRWGDYSATQVDPTDPTTGWGFNQRITSPSQFTGWRTNAGSVQ